MLNYQRKKLMIDFQNARWYQDKVRHGAITNILSSSALFSLIRKVWVINRESFLTVQNYKDMYLSELNRQAFLSTMDDIRSVEDMLAAWNIFSC